MAADEQGNFYLDSVENLITDFKTKEGRDATEAWPAVQAQIQGLRDQGRNNLATPEQRLEFDQQTRHLTSQALARAGDHYDTESKVWAAGVAAHGANLSARGIGEAALSGDDEGVQHHTADLMNWRLTEAIHKFGGQLSPEIENSVLLNARGEATDAQITALIPTNPQKAQQILDQNAEVLRGPRYDTLSAKLNSAVRRANVSGAFDALVNNRDFAPSAAGGALSGDLWARIKGAEGGIGRNGEALVSPKGAIGVSQIIPSTAHEMATDLGLPYDERRLHTDQAYNERLGQGYLDKMLGRYGGNETLAAAAYNAGPQRVDSWLKTIGDPSKAEVTDADFARQIPIAKTRAYVQKIIAGSPRGQPGKSEAAGGAAPAATPAGTPGKFDLSAGDSIGYGLQRFGGLGGSGVADVTLPEAALSDAAGSRNPQQALDYIKTHPERFAGKTVLWSSGLMNAGADPQAALPLVEQQLDALKAAGANVVLAGVDQGGFAAYNPKLAAIAQAKQVAFAGPLPTKNVHPGAQGYKDYAANAATLIPAGAAPPGTPAEQFAGGAVQPTGTGTGGIIPVGASADQIAPAAGPRAAPIPTGAELPAAPSGGAQGAALPLTGQVPRAPLIPPGTPSDRLQAFAGARRLVAGGRLSAAEGEVLERQLDAHYKRVDGAEEHEERLAEHNRKLMQGAISADLYANAIEGKPLDDVAMAQMVRDQRITQEQYNQIRAEQGRRDDGRDNDRVALDLWRRAENREDIGAEIGAARDRGELSKNTARDLIKANAVRQREETNQTERTSFAVLRTVAGGDAVEKGLVDFGNAAHAAQIQLWSQAQGEWNRRVVVGKEEPRAVLADMAPRYSHEIVDVRALPRTRVGAANPQNLDDLGKAWAATTVAHEAGTLTDEQFQNEADLINRYRKILSDQQTRADAAKKATQNAPAGGGARLRGVKPSEAP